MVRVAINGFGRIGRMVFRAGFNNPDIEFVAINDLTGNDVLSYLLKRDSSAGTFDHDVSFSDDSLIVDGSSVKVFAERDPSNLPWSDLNVDVVVESTGFFTKRDLAKKHLDAGAKRVLISAPSSDADFVLVKGVNEHLFDSEKHLVVSNASCTTNCLAPMVKVLEDNFGIEHGFMTTVHAYTGDQKLQDAPVPSGKDLRRARAGALNIVPTSTGAARAVALVVPSLKGKLDGMAFRVPVPVGSVTDFVCTLKKSVTREEINHLFSEVSKSHLNGILEYSEEPLVSSDIVHNVHSCVFDAPSTKVIGGTLLKIVGWYDNEWGYSNRMIDVIKILGA